MNTIGAHFGHVTAPPPQPQGAPPALGGGAKVNLLV